MRALRVLATSMIIVAGLASATVLAAPAAETYEIDPAHSTAMFKAKHLNVSNFYGRFNDVTGTIALDNGDPTSIEVTVKAESIDTYNAKRDQHLKSPDFFNAKQFPTITFKSKEIKKAGDNAYDLTGDVTLLGVTKTITTKLTKTGAGKDPWGGMRVGGETRFSIKRSEFGMTFMPDGISDDVELLVSIEAAKKK